MGNRKNRMDSEEKEREKMARRMELGIAIVLFLVLLCTANLIDYCTPPHLNMLINKDANKPVPYQHIKLSQWKRCGTANTERQTILTDGLPKIF